MTFPSLQQHARQRRFGLWMLLIILSGVAGCQQAEVLATGPRLDSSVTPRPMLMIQPTLTPNRIAALVSLAPTDKPVQTDPATLTPSPLGIVTSFTPTETPTLLPTAAAILPDPAQPSSPLSDPVEIGQSVEGRAITMRQFGDGARVILLIGAIHGGYEANTAALIDGLATHFEAVPSDIRPGITISLIPAANPDGLVRGSGLNARFNANGVDLNRNWLCEWSPDAFWRNQRVDPGDSAMSEPETQVISSLIIALHPAVVLFYHSAAGAVYAGNCEDSNGSSAMSAVYGAAAGYTYGAAFSAYPVTGTASSWVDALGIPSADVELTTHEDSEVERNLRAVMALQDWVLSQPE